MAEITREEKEMSKIKDLMGNTCFEARGAIIETTGEWINAYKGRPAHDGFYLVQLYGYEVRCLYLRDALGQDVFMATGSGDTKRDISSMVAWMAYPKCSVVGVLSENEPKGYLPVTEEFMLEKPLKL